MKSNKFQLIMLLSVLVISMYPTNTVIHGVNAVNGEVYLAKRKEVNSYLASGSGNDIYFQSTIYNSFLPHQYISTVSSYNLYSYQGKTETSLGARAPLTGITTAPNPNAVYHASNTSNQLLDLRYSTVYYDMTNGSNNQEAIKQMIIFKDEYFGLQFEGNTSEPLVFDFKFKGQLDVVTVNFILVTPSGAVFNYATITNQFQTFINHFIPMIPTENGVYKLFINFPDVVANNLDNDLTLEYFKILRNPPVQEITSGFSGRLTGTETATQLFKFKDYNSTSEANVMDLVASTFYNDSVSSPDQLLGTVDLKFFTASIQNPFGGTFPDTITQYKENATYVAVTTTPPNDDNAFVKGLKTQLGLPVGYDVSFTFYGEVLPVENFQPDHEYVVENGLHARPNENHYFWQTTQPYYLSLNHSDAGVVRFTNLENQNELYTLTASNEVLDGSSSNTPMLLPAGDYMVEITTGATAIVEVQILQFQTLDVNNPTVFPIANSEVMLFRIPTASPALEYFNVTYTQAINATVNVKFDLFNENLVHLTSPATFTFEDYYSNPTTRVENNNTVFGDTSPVQGYNMDFLILRAQVTGYQFYNPDGTQNNTIIPQPFTFSFIRQNYLDTWEASADNQYSLSQLTGNVNIPLNGTKNQLLYVYYYETGVSPSGYSFSISSENITYHMYLYSGHQTTGNAWRNVNVNTPTIINGINYYKYNLEFASTEQVQLALVLQFGATPPANGSLSIEINQFLVSQTPGISLGSINVSNYPESRAPNLNIEGTNSTNSSDGGFFSNLGSNGLLIGGGIAAVAVIAALAVFFVRRRSSGAF